MRIIKRIFIVLLTVVIAFGGWAVFLAVTTPRPHPSKDWTRLHDMPRPRGEVASAVGARLDEDCPDPLNCSQTTERFFVIGGIAGLGRVVRSVDIYNPQADSWKRGPDLPEPRHHAAGAGTGGVVYVSGGSIAATNWRPERELWFLLPADNAWQRGPDMPEARMAHQMVAVGSKLYVIGGRGKTSDVLIYDTIEKKWSTGAEMPVKRDHLSAVVLDQTIMAIGGRDSKLTARVDIYDIARDTWSAGPALPERMSAMAAGLTDEPDTGVHVVGGEQPATFGGAVIDRHYFLARGASTWISESKPVIAVHGAASGVVFGRLYIAGGARRQGSLSVLGWTGVLQRYG